MVQDAGQSDMKAFNNNIVITRIVLSHVNSFRTCLALRSLFEQEPLEFGPLLVSTPVRVCHLRYYQDQKEFLARMVRNSVSSGMPYSSQALQ